MAFHDAALSIATSQNWILLGVNLILNTIIGGIVVVILLMIVGRAFGEHPKVTNAFIMVFIIQLVTIFGILGFLSAVLPAGVVTLLPIILWIVLAKAFFGDMVWWHAVIVGGAGYVLSLFLIPGLMGYFSAFIPV